LTGVDPGCSKNIVLSGGSTMFQHFAQRLKRDLKQLVDLRLDASVIASGSQQRVCCSPYFTVPDRGLILSSSLPASRLMSFHTNANGSYFFSLQLAVLKLKYFSYAVWFGGSLLASLVSARLA